MALSLVKTPTTLGAPLDLAVEALDRVDSRHEILGAEVRLW